jgi:hypothetical protein
MKINLGPVLDALINKLHTVLGTAYAIAVLVYVMISGKDVGMGLVAFSGTYYGFLLGHAYTYQKYPDQPDSTSTNQQQ